MGPGPGAGFGAGTFGGLSGFGGGAGPQLAGPFGRGKSPADQRTSAHDTTTAGEKGLIGGLMVGAGIVIIAAGGGPFGAYLTITGFAVAGTAIGQKLQESDRGAGDVQPEEPSDIDTSTDSGGGIPPEEADAGGEDTEDVPVLDDSDSSSKPNPDEYYPAPDGEGMPNSRAAGFPTSFDTYPAPDGDGHVGPRAAGAQLRSAGIALGKGLASTVRVVGPQSFRIAY